MKVFVINGSSNTANGITQVVLTRFLEGIREIFLSFVFLGKEKCLRKSLTNTARPDWNLFRLSGII
jgi:hypothetical protein